MDKDRQESLWKKWKAPLRLMDPRRDTKSTVKGFVPTAAMPPPPALAAAERLSSPPRAVEAAVSESGGTGQELSVDDYFVRVSLCLMLRRGYRLLVSRVLVSGFCMVIYVEFFTLFL
jgi:hypothetical protein